MQDGDMMQVSIEGFGRPLRNPLRMTGTRAEAITVKPLG
jgi:hypothetical protein